MRRRADARLPKLLTGPALRRRVDDEHETMTESSIQPLGIRIMQCGKFAAGTSDAMREGDKNKEIQKINVSEKT